MRQSSDRAADTRGPGEGWSETNSQPIPNLDWGEGWGLQQGEMIGNQGCSAEPEMASMKIQGETAPAFNNPELSPFFSYENKSVLILFLDSPTACVSLPHPHTSGACGIPLISQMTRFPPVSVLRHSQAFTDVLYRKASEIPEAQGPCSAPLCNLSDVAITHLESRLH